MAPKGDTTSKIALSTIRGIEGLRAHEPEIRQFLGEQLGWKGPVSSAEFEELLIRRGVEQFDEASLTHGWAFLTTEYFTYRRRAGKRVPEETSADKRVSRPELPEIAFRPNTVEKICATAILTTSELVTAARSDWGGGVFKTSKEAGVWLMNQASKFPQPTFKGDESIFTKMAWKLLEFEVVDLLGLETLSFYTRGRFGRLNEPSASPELDRLVTAVEFIESAGGVGAKDALRIVMMGDRFVQIPREFVAHEIKVREVPSMTRISLSVDPRLDAKEVAKRYLEARRKLGIKMSRELEPKALQLAATYAMNVIERGRSIAVALEIWNELAADTFMEPTWQYADDDRGRWLFGRDCKAAFKRVIDPFGLGDRLKVENDDEEEQKIEVRTVTLG